MHRGRMRAIVAASLAVLFVLAAGVPHAHVVAHDAHQCLACAVGQGSAAHEQTPDVAPAAFVAAAPQADPGLAPVSGAPLGAVPGQSPPTLG